MITTKRVLSRDEWDMRTVTAAGQHCVVVCAGPVQAIVQAIVTRDLVSGVKMADLKQNS